MDRPAAAPVRRQRLVRLSGAGWRQVLDAPWDDEARACLGLWANAGFPLVVTRQPCGASERVATGLPAPARFGRRRLAVGVAASEVASFDEFPSASAATRVLTPERAAAWPSLVSALAARDCAARVYGGYGWQALTGLDYVHPLSDVDLLLPVASAPHADEIVRVLSGFAWTGPRLDGELLFPDGSAVAWREWGDHRAGRCAQVLVKRLQGVALKSPGPWAA